MILNLIFKGVSVSERDSFFYESYEPVVYNVSFYKA